MLNAITAPILGAYSDRHGRRLVLLVSSAGLLASEITSILTAKYPHIFSVNFLLLGSVIDGLSGSFMVGIAVTHSYAADCTSIAKRAVSFGYLQGSLYLGIAVGPALGGFLIKATGNPLHVFYAAMVSFVFSRVPSAEMLTTMINSDCAWVFHILHFSSLTRVAHTD